MPSRNYRDLIVWQRAMKFVFSVYESTKRFPRDEIFSLTSQMRRGAVSIPSNIAEGQGRGSDAELVRFCRIAHGSLRELETQILIAEKLGYIAATKARELLDDAAEVGRLLNGLIRSKG